MSKDEELTPKERAVFDMLKQPVQPGRHLETKLTERLKVEGLLKNGRALYITWGISIAASFALLVLGAFIGKFVFDAPTADAPSFNYMLVLYEDNTFNPKEPELMFTEYFEWMQKIQERGINIDGQEMKSASIVIEGNGEEQNSEPAKRIGGYFMLSAASMEEVVEIAKNSPHLKYGGTIEIKEFMIR